MQELLGRIARLDPSASLGLRVIACFDELVVGNVNTRALLAAAASLAGCVAGFGRQRPPRTVRVAPDGNLVTGTGPPVRPGFRESASGDLTVWLERDGAARPNDEIIVERLALAVRIRHGYGRRDFDNRRDLGLVVDDTVDAEQRGAAATALGLSSDGRYRMVTAPLFAVWERHPAGPEDVISTAFGPIHAVVVRHDNGPVAAAPCGIGVATEIRDLHHSFRTAMVALRLAEPPLVPLVHADEFGGLVSLLADAGDGAPHPDVEGLMELARHSWGMATVRAIVRSGSVRQAAREAGVHHSTMHTRVEVIARVLGFDPFDGFGRTRLGTAYLIWRLRSSRVLEVPARGTLAEVSGPPSSAGP